MRKFKYIGDSGTSYIIDVVKGVVYDDDFFIRHVSEFCILISEESGFKSDWEEVFEGTLADDVENLVDSFNKLSDEVKEQFKKLINV